MTRDLPPLWAYNPRVHQRLYEMWREALKHQVDENFSDTSVVHQKMIWGDLKYYTNKHDVPINPNQDFYTDDELDAIHEERQERLADAMGGDV